MNKKTFDFKLLGFITLVALAFSISTIISFFLRFNMLMQKPYERINVKWSDESGSIYTDLPIGDGNVLYDLYVPAGLETGKKQHLVMYIHSGNFSSGDKSEGIYIGRYLATKGYIVASVNYTPVVGGNGFGVKDAVNELYGTADTVVKKCKELGFDIENMAVGGEYAGGTLALLYADLSPEKSPVPVEFVFEQTAPTSFDPEKWGYQGEDAVDLVNMMTANSFTVDDIGSEKYLSAFREISPDNYIGSEHVPVIAAYGLKDKMVPSTMGSEYTGALKNAGIDATLIEYPNSGHLMIHDKDKNNEYYNTVDSYLEKYMLK